MALYCSVLLLRFMSYIFMHCFDSAFACSHILLYQLSYLNNASVGEFCDYIRHKVWPSLKQKNYNIFMLKVMLKIIILKIFYKFYIILYDKKILCQSKCSIFEIRVYIK